MSKNLILHVDGSAKRMNKQTNYVFGWGIIALCDDSHHEAGGYVKNTLKESLTGEHETIGLIKAIAWAYNNKFKPADISCFCDDEMLGYSNTYMNPYNLLQGKKDTIVNRIIKTQPRIEPELELDIILSYLADMRITKLKGHKNEVYQERVNYIANWYANNENPERLPYEDYDTWIKKGFINYKNPNERYIHLPPFVEAHTI